MIKNKKISLIIPCLNEETGLSQLLPLIPKFIDEVIIIDGDSKDNSVNIAKKYKAEVIIEKKKGYGLALRRGFYYAKNELLVTLDGDGTYPIYEIANMRKYFNANKLDLLVACRFPLKNKDAMKVKNFFGNLLISAFTSLIYGHQKTDVCSGMWMMSKTTWKLLSNKVKDDSWFFSNEIKIEAMKNKNIKYEEYWIELKKRSGETKVGNVWIIGLKVLLQTIYKRFI